MELSDEASGAGEKSTSAKNGVEAFEIVYDGPALASHTMDVRELAPALLGIADLCQEANRILNGERATVAVNVESEFRPGCFSVSLQLVQSLGTELQTMLSPGHLWTAKTLLEVLGLLGTTAGAGLIGLMRWIKARKVEAVEPNPNVPGTSRVRIGDDVLIVNNGTLNVFNDGAARSALAQTLKPLERSGIDKFEVRQNDTPIERVRKDEVPYFSTGGVEDLLETKEDVAPFEIIKPSFESRLKWMLSDGNGTFGVYIRDQRFLDQLDRRQITFAKGDVLRVKYKRTTWRTEQGLRSEYEILQVLELVPAPRQLPLPIDPSGAPPPARRVFFPDKP